MIAIVLETMIEPQQEYRLEMFRKIIMTDENLNQNSQQSKFPLHILYTTQEMRSAYSKTPTGWKYQYYMDICQDLVQLNE